MIGCCGFLYYYFFICLNEMFCLILLVGVKNGNNSFSLWIYIGDKVVVFFVIMMISKGKVIKCVRII